MMVSRMIKTNHHKFKILSLEVDAYHCLARFALGAEWVRSEAARFRCPGLRSTRLGAGMVRRPSDEVMCVGRWVGR